MLFNSLHFLLFFPVVVLLFFSLKDRSRIYWLIAASCYFYMAFVPAYILILFFLILLDYAAGLMIARSQAPTRHLWLVLSIVGNVTMLGFYKYFNFLDQNIVALAQWIGFDYTGSQMNIVLPIGLSFHTFQSMSYVFEVYRGRQPAERDLPVYSLVRSLLPTDGRRSDRATAEPARPVASHPPLRSRKGGVRSRDDGDWVLQEARHR